MKKEKLDIHDLKGYLGNRLKIKVLEFYGVEIEYFLDEVFHNLEYDITKPILRPDSQLTQEITHNGETFIPIVELAKIAVISEISLNIVDYESRDNIRHECSIILNGKLISFFYHSDMSSFYIQERNLNLIAPDFQHQLFEKLHEWHFAINIPSHLYIEKPAK